MAGKNDVLTLRLGDIVHSIFKHKLMIIILSVVGLIIGILLSIVSYMRGEMAKEYAITSSFAVTSVTEDGLFTTHTVNPTSTDIYLAQSMVDSVIYVIKSDRTLNAAIDYLKLLGVTSKEINRNLTLNQYNETQIVEMTLYWRSAEEGVQILSAINAVSPDILIDTLKIGGLSVVNDPTSRYLIGGSVNASMWVYMTIMGFVLGCGLSILNMILKPTLTNTKDVENKFGLEVIGTIRHDKAFFSRKHIAADDAYSDMEDSAVRESISAAAHILLNRLKKQEHNCIYVTSSIAKEGRTSIAANLAVQLSDLEKKVLLIDCDVQSPGLGTMFIDKVEYDRSLNALYRGDAEEKDVIIPLTGYLDLVPGILEHKALPLDEAMIAIVEKLSKEYDYVILDTAPVGIVSETMNLSKIADTALFVIQYDTVGIADIKNTLEKMDKAGIHISGCIINDIKKANYFDILKMNRGQIWKGNRNSREKVDKLTKQAEESKAKSEINKENDEKQDK